MTVIKNCPNCGGEHWGSLRCPFLPGELHKTIRPWPSLPNRDVPALIELLRIRALALTGERWERDATRGMMNEAADRLEELNSASRDDVADLAAELMACRRELQARRAADPTPEQRSWYRGMAEEFGLAGADWATTAFPAPVSLAYRHSRIAAHFGRLALGQREDA